MRVLIAPDHFGGTLTAVQTGELMARPWRAAGHPVALRAMSDGGTGLVEAAHAALGGSLIPVNVSGARGEGVPAGVLHVPGSAGGSAYIEGGAVLGAGSDGDMALDLATNGSSAGLADLLQAALDTGAQRVVIGLGPSPTHDGGAGLLRRLATLAGAQVEAADEPWRAVAHLRTHLADLDLVVAAAQDTPLLGLHGAGAGLQQFGISALQAQQVESRISAYAHAAMGHVRSLAPVRQVLGGRAGAPEPGASHTGAGGGVAFALGLVGARVLPGALVVGEQIGVREAIGDCDLVLTGAHCLDADTLYEGVVQYVGSQAAEYGWPVVALARSVYVSRRELAKVGISAAYPLVDQPLLPGNRRTTDVDPVQALEQRSARVMRNWSRA